MKSLLIKDAAQVVTPLGTFSRGKTMKNLKVINNGSVYIEGEKIKSVGSLKDIDRNITGNPKIVDARGKIVIPGFVDSHTHLVFAGTREEEFIMRLAGMSYQEISKKGGGILSTVKKTRTASKDELFEISKSYVDSAVKNGTTTLEIKSGYGLDAENESKILDVIADLNKECDIDIIPTFMGAHAVPSGRSKDQYVNEVIEMIGALADKAKFCDIFCEAGYFDIEDSRKILNEAGKHGLSLKMHADQFTNNNGIKLSVELAVTSVDHLETISNDEIRLLARSKVAAVLTPGVSYFLNYGYPPARKLIDSDCIVSIATDFNPGTCMSISMQMMISIACTQMNMMPDEAITAATLNGAYALGLTDRGSIEEGKLADLAVLNISSYKMLPYFFGINHVVSIIKNGEVIF
ncbi:MAG: imidazolonepropionase [Planctomycetes bacterium]|nr:imidazolonepropionase [Planctomycetota bacterium]